MKKTLVILTVHSFIGVQLFAQAFNNQQEQPAVAVNIAIDATNDSATNIVQEVQQEAPAVEQSLSINEELKAVMKDLGINQGWDSDRQMMVISEKIDGSPMKTSPRYTKGFLTYRRIMYARAILQSKGRVIQAIGQRMSAKEQMSVILPSEDQNALNEAEQMLQDLKKDAESLEAEMGVAKGKIEDGPSLADRKDDLIAAIIKNLDSSYDPGKHTKEQQAALIEMKSIHADVAQQIKVLEEKTKARAGDLVSSFSSTVSSVSAMPLAGCTTLYTCEEYDPKTKSFSVGVITIWSVKLMQAAKLALTGKVPVKLKKNVKKMTINEWAKNTLDLRKDFGPRTYVDDQGRRFFIGIAASVLTEGGGTFNDINRDKARIAAQQMAQFSMRADLENQVASGDELKEITTGNGKELEMQIKESFEKMVSQVFEDREIEGALELLSDEVTHPISRKKMYVSVAYVNPDLAAAAGAFKAENWQIKKGEQARNDGIRDRDEKGRNAPLDRRPNTDRPSRPGQKNAPVDVKGAVGNRPDKSVLDDF